MIVISSSGSSPHSITLYDAARLYGGHKPAFKAVEIRYQPLLKLIDVTIYEDRQDVSVPLILQFEYKPSMGSTVIYKLAEGRNKQIKEFYWKLWYGDGAILPDIDIQEVLTGLEITIDAISVEKLCTVMGKLDESFKSARNMDVKAPMDFAIVTGWQVRF